MYYKAQTNKKNKQPGKANKEKDGHRELQTCCCSRNFRGLAVSSSSSFVPAPEPRPSLHYRAAAEPPPKVAVVAYKTPNRPVTSRGVLKEGEGEKNNKPITPVGKA